MAVTHSLDLHTDWNPVLFWCKADVGVESSAIVLVRANAPLWIHSGVADNFPSPALG